LIITDHSAIYAHELDLVKDDPVLEIHVALGGCFVFTYRRVYLRLEVRSRVAGGWLLEI
jgi:hypothetical protein